MPLDPRESRFLDEYLVDLDVERAAGAAGYSQSMARSKCYQWVSNGKEKPELFAELQRRQQARAKRTEITQDRVLAEFARIGFADLRTLFAADGSLRPISDLSDDEAAPLASVEVVTKVTPGRGKAPATVERVHKIRAADKVQALTQLGRHLGMFVDRSQQLGADGKPINPGATFVLTVQR